MKKAIISSGCTVTDLFIAKFCGGGIFDEYRVSRRILAGKILIYTKEGKVEEFPEKYFTIMEG